MSLLMEMMLLLVEMVLLLVEIIQLFLRYSPHQYCTREKLSSCYLGSVYQRYISVIACIGFLFYTIKNLNN